MRDVNRIPDVLTCFRTLWEQYPDWRFGQLINNMQRKLGNDLFFIEDDEIIRIVKQLTEEGF